MLYVPSGTNLVLFFLGGLVGCLLPDVDHPRAIAGYIIPLHKIVKHGHCTHTIAFSLILMIVYYFTSSYVWFGMWFGYLSHLIGDNLQGNNLKYLWFPLKRGVWFKNKKRK